MCIDTSDGIDKFPDHTSPVFLVLRHWRAAAAMAAAAVAGAVWKEGDS